MLLLEHFYKHLNENPDRITLEDNNGTLTVKELDVLSGRVYGYLKSKGISKENIVVILLPRGIESIAVLLGVIKAGAAFVPLEAGLPEERIAYICKDCNADLIIDSENWNEIKLSDYLVGYETVDLHDLAYIIYTSGSTGNPKGVVHEYGNIEREVLNNLDLCERYWKDLTEEAREQEMISERGLTVTPFYFMASVIGCIQIISQACYSYMISYDDFKNFNVFKQILLDKKISSTFLTTSYVDAIDEFKTPYLQYVFVGAERVNNIYDKDLLFVNGYGMTESGCDIACFYIDQPYANTPVGIPGKRLDVKLLDDDGNEVPVGEMGEITFKNEYCRGYLNLPEQTKAVFKNGRFYTGDLGLILPDGNMVVKGRIDEMIKINGNRVEPAEIESAVKDILGINWAYVKAFKENERSFLCAYYIDDIEVDSEKTIAALLTRLPMYMIPSYYIKVDEIPRLPNGKVDRRAFEAPDIDHYLTPYVAPSNKDEEQLCQAFATVLGRDRVGIHDDFYELGGDSLSAVAILSECDLPGLDVVTIFKNRTADKIINAYHEQICYNDQPIQKTTRTRNLKKERHSSFFYRLIRKSSKENKNYPLGGSQKLMLWESFQPKKQSETREFTAIRCYFGIAEDGDAYALERAWFMLLEKNDALRQRIVFNQGFKIKIEEPNYQPLQHIKLEDSQDDLEKLLLEECDPGPAAFNSMLANAKLCFWRKGVYLFINLSHVGFDGYSINLMFQRLCEYYRFITEGVALSAVESKEYSYISQIERESKYRYSENYRKDKIYWQEVFSRQPNYQLPFGRSAKSSYCKNKFCAFGLERTLKINDFCKKLDCSPSYLVMHLLALTIWKYKGCENFVISSINHGRKSPAAKYTIGNLFNMLLVYYNIDLNQTIDTAIRNGYIEYINDMIHSRYIMNNQIDTLLTMDKLIYKKGKKRTGMLFDHFWFVYSPMDGMDFELDSDFSMGMLPMQRIMYAIYCALFQNKEQGLYLYFAYQSEKFTSEEIENFCDLLHYITDAVLKNPEMKLSEF